MSIDACPKCGDTTAGYEYREMVVDERNGAWGAPSESSGILAGNPPKTVKCVACGARVNRELAEGGAAAPNEREGGR